MLTATHQGMVELNFKFDEGLHTTLNLMRVLYVLGYRLASSPLGVLCQVVISKQFTLNNLCALNLVTASK